MSTYILVQDAAAWTEPTKLSVTQLDTALLNQSVTQVLARLGVAYTTTGWTDNNTTPALVKSIISMIYVANVYDKAYSEDAALDPWAEMLRAMAETNIQGILDGTLVLPDAAPGTSLGSGQIGYYPTDASSALCPEPPDMWGQGDLSLGDAKFSMGMSF